MKYRRPRHMVHDISLLSVEFRSFPRENYIHLGDPRRRQCSIPFSPYENLLYFSANLSDQYFERRQDRYFLFRDSPELADYYTNLVKSVGRFSFQLDASNKLWLENEDGLHPYETPFSKFVTYSKRLLAEFIDPKSSSETESSYDTHVYPLVQMGQLEFGNDCTVTKKVLEIFPEGSHVKLATGYFNLVPEYEELIANGRALYDVVTAHPKANSFYKAAGAMYYIPVKIGTEISRGDFLVLIFESCFGEIIMPSARGGESFPSAHAHGFITA